jgi:hypothetical protein
MKLKELTSVAEVIDALGGKNAVAEAFGFTPNAVAHWARHGAFPAHTYLAIGAELRRLGFACSVHKWSFSRADFPPS